MAETTTSTTSTSRMGSLMGSRKRTQLEVLQQLVSKHITDPSLVDLASNQDFAITSTERGISRYENTHLVAALDTLLAYQRDRRAKALGGLANMRRSYTHDPRTRLIELLKRWLRQNAPNKDVQEEEVHRVCSLCRDVLNHPNLFPSRNVRSFMQTLAEVYQHLQVQLREVLERDRTCAELAVRCLSLSRNLIADAVIFLLLALTDLAKTDKLPSVEVVALWQCLPTECNPLPSRVDQKQQKVMQDSWQTTCGSMIAKLLGMKPTFRLFDGAGAEAEAAVTAGEAAQRARDAPPGSGQRAAEETALALSPSADSMTAFLTQVREELEKDVLKSTCGFAGPFREPRLKKLRMTYVAAAEAVFHLLYLLGEVLVHFQRISDGMGDYGMIRVAPWLHPFLDAIVDKVLQLKSHLDALNAGVDSELVLAKARGLKVKKPLPTDLQLNRAHGAIERAVTARECHSVLLTKAIEDLRARSAPERLPHVVEGIHDACSQLEHVFSSPQFRECVGDAFPDLPTLTEMAAARAQPGLFDAGADGSMRALEGAYSDDEDEEEGQSSSWWPRSSSRASRRRSGDASPRSIAEEPAADGTSGRSTSLRRRAYDKAKRALSRGASGRFDNRSNQAEVVASGRFPPDDPDLPREGWICHHGANGRIFWHHSSLGPAPWESTSWVDGSPVSPVSQPSAPSREPRSPRERPRAPDAPAAPSWLDDDTESSAAPTPVHSSAKPRLDDGTYDAGAQDPSPQFGASTGEFSPPSRAPHPSGELRPRQAPVIPTPSHSDTTSAAATPVAPGMEPVTPNSLHDVQAEVYRMSGTRSGWKVHDQRMLLLQGDRLHVFEKGSMDQVKLSVDLVREVDEEPEVSLLESGILSLQIQRRRVSAFSSGAQEQKMYTFQFEPQSRAAAFRDEMFRRQEAAKQRCPGPGMTM